MNDNFITLNANDFEKAIANSTTIILDVRTADEYRSGHIPNAINIDMSRPDFEKRLSKHKTLAVYCKNGVRSKMTAIILANRGFRVVYLDGGITEWEKAGKTTE
ncbi:MAG: rhodanese-like domain-containing protein [Bacteroidales bacterium]|nr:rhodanese-like domain-containing protein [Bacteroidales bacterium]